MELDGGAQILVDTVASFVAPELVPAVRDALGRVLRQASDAERRGLLDQLMSTGSHWGYFSANTLARTINYELGQLIVLAGSTLRGIHHVAERGGPCVYLANHLSFSDANLFAYLLQREGHAALASKLCVLAGPKVFTDPFRRFSSLSFGAIKLPQSADRASGDARMPRREIARLAAETITSTVQRLEAGDHLLVFIEGSRSRSAAMQPALGAVSRYLEVPGTQVIPLAITGSEHLMPITEERARPTHVTITLGAPLAADQLIVTSQGNRSSMMHAVGLAIARQLPSSYRGHYLDESTAELIRAAQVLDAARARTSQAGDAAASS